MTVYEMIVEAAARGASDIHLITPLHPKVRIDGQLQDLSEEEVTDALLAEFAQSAAQIDVSSPEFCGEADFAVSHEGIRVRANIFKQRGHLSASLRILHAFIPKLDSLGLPPDVAAITQLSHGLFLVTGETGSGKSTTLASIIDTINHTRSCHVITLEDPIEYIYTPDKCIFNQREVGTDTWSFANGLRASLREDPDIILIGEMRDLDTIETAITAAETGHLVLATLHSASASDTVDRIVSSFPEEKQHQIRLQLSTTLKAVLSQQLLPKRGGGRVVACEYMLVNCAVQNLIREGKTPQINNVITTTANEGAISMDNSIIRLYRNRIIDIETAKSAAHDEEYISKNIR